MPRMVARLRSRARAIARESGSESRPGRERALERLSIGSTRLNVALKLGSSQAVERAAFAKGRLADAFLLVRSAYVPLAEWDGFACADCGRRADRCTDEGRLPRRRQFRSLDHGVRV